MPETRFETPLRVVFVDLTRFAAQGNTPSSTDIRLEDRRVR
jgi:hypothetical protein